MIHRSRGRKRIRMHFFQYEENNFFCCFLSCKIQEKLSNLFLFLPLNLPNKTPICHLFDSVFWQHNSNHTFIIQQTDDLIYKFLFIYPANVTYCLSVSYEENLRNRFYFIQYSKYQLSFSNFIELDFKFHCLN